jgi:hypothetical protein
MKRSVAVPAVVLTALLAGCGVVGAPRASDPEPKPAIVRDGEFELEITSPRSEWAANEPIEVTAELRYLGSAERIEIGGSGAGPISFGVYELGGMRRMDAMWQMDCAPHKLGPDAPIVAAYQKSGGWAPDDPNRGFYEAFFADPEFRLPAGRWQVDAWARFGVGACDGRQVDARASLILTVE